MEVKRQREVLFGLMFCLLGYAAHFGSPVSLCLTIPASCLLAVRSSRSEAFVSAVLYYAFALLSMPAAIRGFWQEHSGGMFLLYPCAVLLLSLPWVLLWGRNFVELRCVGAVLVTAVPPTGLIAWYSPFSAAGWLFPGVGLVCGLFLVAVFLFWGTAAASGDRIWRWHPGRKVSSVALILLAGASVMASVGYAHPRREGQYPRFVGADLQRGQLRRESPEYQDQIKSAVYGFPHASVIVLPEATFLAVSPVTDFFFQDEFKALADTDRVLIAGATIAGAGDQYRNGFILRGAQVGFVDERVPVPVAMWKPFLDSGAQLHLMASSTVNVHGTKTAVLVCYEMVIPWTAMTALAEHPDELVGIANDDWAAGAPVVPKLQRNTLTGWARLAGIDSVFAANLPLEVAR